MGKRILYVYDLPIDTRARDLGREFERYGPIVRCDVPAPRRDARYAYAFVEYEDYRDASDAYQRLHGKPFQGGSIRIEWAKRGPDARRDRFDSRRERRGRSRSRSPRRNQESDDDRKADRSRSRSRSPIRSRSRSPSPNRSASPVRSPKMSDHEGSI